MAILYKKGNGMLSRFLVFSLLSLLSLDGLSLSARRSFNVDDVTPEMLEKTLPTNFDSYQDSEDFDVDDVTPEMLEKTLPNWREYTEADLSNKKKNSKTKQSTSSLSSANPTIKELITTLENEPQRLKLIKQLKAFVSSDTLNSPHLIFVQAFASVKGFIKTFEAEIRHFSTSLLKKSTWSFKVNNPFLQEVKDVQGFKLLYLVLIALSAQIILAAILKAGFPPLFGKLRRDFSTTTFFRTLTSISGFVAVAYLAKGFFVSGETMHVYGSEVIINVTLLQVGILLMRASISTGIFPVKLEHQSSLFRLFFMVLLLWMGQTYAAEIIQFASQATTISHPTVQLFWGLVTTLILMNLRKNRPVFEGMLFREIPFLEKSSVLEMQKIVAGTIYHLITWGIGLIYISWFIGYSKMFQYLEAQLIFTLLILFGISVLSYLLVYSSGYLSGATIKNKNLEIITQRLINILSFSGVSFIVYRWVIPIAKMQGISTQKVSDKMFGVIVIIVITIIVLQGLSRMFSSSIMKAGRNKHLKTFLPILDRVSKIFVFFIAGFFLLIELKVDVMPILASFSILGLGIGLASKTIIEDFINGLFIIQENDINIGDIVSVAGVTGQIENITLRKVHIRDGQGFLNFIPFSHISAVVNRSRDFNLIRMDVPLPSRYHLKRTAGILEDVGEQLLNDPEIKDFIIIPPKFIGVSDFICTDNPNNEITKLMQFEIKVKPSKSRIVSIEFRKLVTLAFEEMDRVMK